MLNQDASCKLKELVARLHESVARLEDMRSALWLSAYNLPAFNEWYDNHCAKHGIADSNSCEDSMKTP
jgi:hypothetical protein